MPVKTFTGDRPLLHLPAVAERLNVNQRHVRRLVAERRIPWTATPASRVTRRGGTLLPEA